MKFKNIKKKSRSGKKKAKLPSNSRTITEFKFSLPKLNHLTLLRIYRGSLKAFIIFIFLLATLIVGLDLQKNLNLKRNVNIQREKLAKDLKFWQSFIAKHNDYADGYFQASALEYKLGDRAQAKLYLDNGLGLDQNSENGKKLEQLLVSK